MPEKVMTRADQIKPEIQAVLFDLDGTFADTAPDLAYALNSVREENGLTALPFDLIRQHTSHGANALIRVGFPDLDDEVRFSALRSSLLDHYQQHIARETKPFDGMLELIEILEQREVPWGIVTNKPGYLTDPLMQALELDQRAACIVSGDTTAHSKPHPASLFYAADQIRIPPENCLYVGDAERDIEAGHRAGMIKLVALFGYLSETDQPDTWQADGMIEHPLDVLDWL